MSEVFPTEIWLRILDFVPDNNLFKLAIVNRLFYDVAFDRRYYLLVLPYYRPIDLRAQLSRVQDLRIVTCVRSLKIDPVDIHESCLGPHKHAKLRPVQSPHWPEAYRKHTEGRKILEDVHMAEELLDVLARLTNLNSYTITWRYNPRPNRPFFMAFLTAVWAVISASATLHSLTFDMPFYGVTEVFSVTPFESLTYLTSFTLKFDSPYVQPKYSPADTASFLNRLSPSLRSLSLHVTGHFNLSSFFSALGFFPLLRHLRLSLPCDPKHLSNPQGFTTFLDAHKMQLEFLSFSPHFCCKPLESKYLPQESMDWQSPAFSTLSFPALHSLELRLNTLGKREEYNLCAPQKFTAAIARERLGAHELSSDGKGSQDTTKGPVPLTLSILGQSILLYDVKMLLNPFSPPKEKSNVEPITSIRVPETLILETHILSPNLLSLLSETLPKLKSLNLTYTWIEGLGSNDEQNFINCLKWKTFPDWHLENFALNSTMNEDSCRRCERAIRRAVPSLDPIRSM